MDRNTTPNLQLRPPRCLAIIPAFNERSSVGHVVLELKRKMPELDIVVIDDGSTDDTCQQIPPEATVVSLPFNLGIGGAMQTGYRYAAMNRYDIAVQVDADGQHPAGQVRRLIQAVQAGEADLIVGSRFLRSQRKYPQTMVRRAGAWMLRASIHGLTGLTITDCTSGFRAANRKVIQAFAHWYPEDYPEPEVILLLHRAGFRVREMPVRMRRRKSGQSSINVASGLFYVTKVVSCLLLDMVRQPWPKAKVGIA